MKPVVSRRVAVLCATVAAVVGACTSFQSSPAPDSGADGGPDADASVADGGSPDQGVPADGDSDAATVRSPNIPDASYVGCSADSLATFCDDFDSETDFARWSSVQSAGPATVDFDSTSFLSPPKSVVVTVPPQAPPGTQAYLKYAASPYKNTITADFDVFPHAIGDRDSASVLEIVANPGSSFYRARLDVRRSELSVLLFNYTIDPSVGQAVTLAPGLPLGQWAHVTFTLELSADGKASTFSVDVPGLATPVTKRHIAVDFPSSLLTDVQVGINNLGSAQEAWTVSFDNVAITMK